MWARRLGAPHLWPSRVKVFFLGVFTSMFNFSVFQYLHNANVEYLDLEDPVKNDIRCMLPRPECMRAKDPVSCTVLLEDRQFWRGMNLSKPCPLSPKTVTGQTCRNPMLPLGSITGESGSLHTVNSGVNPFKLWSILFLVLTSLLSVSIVIHDMALLQEDLRPQILSIPNMKYATPCLWDCLACAPCRRFWRRHGSRKCRRYIWTISVPFVSLFQVVAFMVVMYPFSLLVCLVAPVKMSRIMVFLSSILCMLWSVVFVIVTAGVDTHAYAVLWGLADRQQSFHCVCMCEFPLSRSVLGRVVLLGIGVCWQSFNLTFRALRGLRRAQWANMFSVLYAIPIEAFPVVWERPSEVGGGPVHWRTVGEAVQSEPAFDPFCLMDEQPESGWTRALITPVSKTDQQQFVWDPYIGTLDTEIGCCGFPRQMSIPEDDDDTDSPPADFGPTYPVSTQESPSCRHVVDDDDDEDGDEDAGAGAQGSEQPTAARGAAGAAAPTPLPAGTILGRPSLTLPVAHPAGPSPISDTSSSVAPEPRGFSMQAADADGSPADGSAEADPAGASELPKGGSDQPLQRPD